MVEDLIYEVHYEVIMPVNGFQETFRFTCCDDNLDRVKIKAVCALEGLTNREVIVWHIDRIQDTVEHYALIH